MLVVLQEIQGNIMTRNGKGQEQVSSTTIENMREEEFQGKFLCASVEKKSSPLNNGVRHIQE